MEEPIKQTVAEKAKLMIDLGCGPRKASPHHVGIDKVRMPGVDIQLDLERGKLPFENNTVDEIVASHVLEHVSNYVQLVNEMWRVLKHDGRLLVSVPHYLWEGAYTDPTHIRRFTRQSFNFFDERKVLFKETGWYLAPARFSIDRVVEGKREIQYYLTAKKKRILLVAPRSSIHTRRWKQYLSSTSHRVNVASRLMLGDIVDFGMGTDDLDKEEQTDRFPEELEKILSREKFDVVHAHFATRYGEVLRVVPKGVRKVLSVWGEDVLYEAENNSKDKKRLVEGIKHTDYITTTSEHMKKVLIEKYKVDAKKVWVITWGYTSRFYPKRELNTRRLQELGIAEGKVILSGRVCRPQNNIERIVRGLDRVETDCLLVILTGDLANQEYTRELKERYSTRRNIKFLPTLSEEDLALVYNRALATISIPEVDQLSTTILESLACGTPVICSDIPVYHERIVDGRNGVIVDYNDPLWLAKAVRNIENREEMKDAAVNSVIADSWEKNAIDMLKVYDAPK